MSKIVFLHIPKTGGTSVHEFLTAKFPKNEICPDRLNTLKEHTQDQLDKYSFFSGHYDIDSVAYIPGNKKIFTFLRDPKERLLSLYYFWRSHKEDYINKNGLAGPRAAKEMDLLNFLKCKEHEIPLNFNNYIARAFSGEMYCGPNNEYIYHENEVIDVAKKNISSLDTIGFMDNFDASYAMVIRQLGYTPPEITPHAMKGSKHQDPNREEITKQPLTDEIEDLIMKMTDLDYKIYNFAKSITQKS